VSARWNRIDESRIEVRSVTGITVRLFGVVMVTFGAAFLVFAIGGLLRQGAATTFDAGKLGVFSVILLFLAVGIWAAAHRRFQVLDRSTNTFVEGYSVLGLRRLRERPLSDFLRVVFVTQPPVDDGQLSYWVNLLASRSDWVNLTDTYDIREAGDLGRAVAELLDRPLEEMTQTQWERVTGR
jgi:hypothetical protein